MAIPKLTYNKEVVRKQTEKKELADDITARFVIVGAARSIWEKEDRAPEKRGTMAVTLTCSPMADPRDARTLMKAYKIRTNIILPVANPDYPEHKEPNTAGFCSRWAMALMPEALPPVPQWDKAKKVFVMSKWDGDESRWVPAPDENGVIATIAGNDDKAKAQAQLEVDFASVALFGDIFQDDAKLAQLKGLAFYARTQSSGGFQGLESPSATMPQGKQYGPLPTED